MRLGEPTPSLDTLEKQFLQLFLNIFQRVVVRPSSLSSITVQFSVELFAQRQRLHITEEFNLKFYCLRSLHTCDV
jgi:hypothetical protein